LSPPDPRLFNLKMLPKKCSGLTLWIHTRYRRNKILRENPVEVTGAQYTKLRYMYISLTFHNYNNKKGNIQTYKKLKRIYTNLNH